MLASSAQQSAPQAIPEDVFPTLLSVLAAVILGGIIIYFVRNWARRTDDTSPGFTLGDLRELRDSGEITEQEFKAARNAMISQVRKQSSPTDDGGSLGDRGRTS
ncbi:MAG: SHOCT domain-containing protein [Planctomycetes bacterium]|nr:SHOCT domain-containing protein [Planctomycetota bacterium]